MSDLRGVNYVLLGSQRPDVGEAMRPFCRLLHMDEQEARLLLTQPGPRLFRAYHRLSQAQGLANQLRAIGLAATALGAEELAKYVFLDSRQVNLGMGGLSAFGREGDAPTFIAFSDIAAIVQGEVMTVTGRERVMAPRPGEPRVRVTYTPMTILDVHRKSVPVAVRFHKKDFHMNPVVAGEPIEGPTDLPRFVELVRQRSPLALLDDKFTRSTAAVDYSLRMLDAGEAALPPRPAPGEEEPAAPPPLPPAPADDPNRTRDETAFNLYSTLWRYQAIIE